jgi:2-polyprenyl-6-hydroxyphenyl methylase/3-demethylubiquinone-9 3-methyltransferase
VKFTFGENWAEYSQLLNEGRIEDAEDNLRRLLGTASLEGRSFIDVGAGSGLFSIAAVRLGASAVVALDRDEQCLTAIRRNSQRFLDPHAVNAVTVRYGDILKPDTIAIAPADVVYAWGSLHHTGRMWNAIENAGHLCKGGGQFVLAIYNRTPLSGFWLAAKRTYAAAPRFAGLAMAAALSLARSAARVVRGKHPFRSERGMSVWYDAVDWLGGLPYECATSDELIQFVERLGFRHVRSNLTRRSGCSEFTFQRQHPCAGSPAS